MQEVLFMAGGRILLEIDVDLHDCLEVPTFLVWVRHIRDECFPTVSCDGVVLPVVQSLQFQSGPASKFRGERDSNGRVVAVLADFRVCQWQYTFCIYLSLLCSRINLKVSVCVVRVAFHRPISLEWGAGHSPSRLTFVESKTFNVMASYHHPPINKLRLESVSTVSCAASTSCPSLSNTATSLFRTHKHTAVSCSGALRADAKGYSLQG